MLTLTFANFKPGTGKTTSSVWLAHAFAETGRRVLLVDADPAASALRWSDLGGGFPFRIAGLPVKDLHQRVQDIARPDDVVIIDAPQIEDHAAIARSAMRTADEVIVPCAPTPIELERTAPVMGEIEAVNVVRQVPVRCSVLLNRTIAHARSTDDAREALEGFGFAVLLTSIPRLEVYAQSFGSTLPDYAAGIWLALAAELSARAQMTEVTR